MFAFEQSHSPRTAILDGEALRKSDRSDRRAHQEDMKRGIE